MTAAAIFSSLSDLLPKLGGHGKQAFSIGLRLLPTRLCVELTTNLCTEPRKSDMKHLRIRAVASITLIVRRSLLTRKYLVVSRLSRPTDDDCYCDVHNCFMETNIRTHQNNSTHRSRLAALLRNTQDHRNCYAYALAERCKATYDAD